MIMNDTPEAQSNTRAGRPVTQRLVLGAGAAPALEMRSLIEEVPLGTMRMSRPSPAAPPWLTVLGR
jgi:hypothetical protein